MMESFRPPDGDGVVPAGGDNTLAGSLVASAGTTEGDRPSSGLTNDKPCVMASNPAGLLADNRPGKAARRAWMLAADAGETMA